MPKNNIYSKTIYILLSLTLISAVLFFSIFTRDMGLVKTYFSQIFILISFLIFIIKHQKYKNINFELTDIHLLFIIFLIYVFINFLFTLFSIYRLYPSSFEEFFRFLNYGILIFIIYNSVLSLKKIIFFLKIIFFISVITIIYSSFQKLGIDFKQMPKGTIVATLGNPNFYAGFINIAFFTNLFFIFSKKYKALRYPAILVNLILFWDLMLTEARAGWLGFFSSLFIFYIIFYIKTKKYKKQFTIFTGVFIIVFLLMLFFTPIGKKIVYKIETKFNIEYGSGYMRLHTYLAALRAIRDNFIVGTGIGTYQIFSPIYRSPLYLYYHITNNQLHTHSEYLELFYELGIIGIILFVMIFLNYFIKIFRYFRHHINFEFILIQVVLFCAIISTLIHNFFSVNLRFTSTAISFWFIFGLSISLLNYKKQNKILKINNSPNYIFPIILLLFICVLIYIYTNQTISNYYMQKATSYERVDSRFVGADGKNHPEYRNFYLNDIYSKAMKHNKYAFEPYYKLAHVYYVLSDIDKTKKYLDKSLKMYLKLKRMAPFYSNLNFNLSLFYLKKKDILNAIYYLKREIYVNSELKNINQLLTYYRLLNQPNKIKILLKNYLWIEKNNISLRSLLAYEYFQKKEYSFAVDEYSTITNIFNEKNDVPLKLGNPIFYNYNNKYNFILGRYPDLNLKIEAIRNIGVIYYYQKNYKLTKIYFNKYLKLSNNIKSKQNIQNILKRIK